MNSVECAQTYAGEEGAGLIQHGAGKCQLVCPIYHGERLLQRWHTAGPDGAHHFRATQHARYLAVCGMRRQVGTECRAICFELHELHEGRRVKIER